jgi:curli biogenesis system outer membrane secretion channel CsgG
MRVRHKALLVLCILGLSSPLAAQTAKKRVAVLDFEYATVYGSVDAIFGTRVDVGKGIRDLLIDRLVQSGSFSVIERGAVEKILAEQNFGASGRVDPPTAAQIGKILGVDVLILGSITTFGRDDTTKKKGGLGGIVVPVPIIGGIGVKKDKAKAVVGISFRMVATDTAEILHTGSAKGESTREGSSLALGGAAGGAFGAGGASMSSSNFGETIIGEAVNDAVKNLSELIKQKADTIPQHKVTIDAMVADVSGKTVVINIGKKAGLKVGDKLEVRQVKREVKDPVSGKVLHRLAEKIGDMVLTEVYDEAAVGAYSGTILPKVKDQVTSPQQ